MLLLLLFFQRLMCRYRYKHVVTFGGWKEDFMLVVNQSIMRGGNTVEQGTQRLLFVMPRAKVILIKLKFNPGLYCFCFSALRDWSRKVAPNFKPIRCEAKTDCLFPFSQPSCRLFAIDGAETCFSVTDFGNHLAYGELHQCHSQTKRYHM